MFSLKSRGKTGAAEHHTFYISPTNKKQDSFADLSSFRGHKSAEIPDFAIGFPITVYDAATELPRLQYEDAFAAKPAKVKSMLNIPGDLYIAAEKYHNIIPAIYICRNDNSRQIFATRPLPNSTTLSKLARISRRPESIVGFAIIFAAFDQKGSFCGLIQPQNSADYIDAKTFAAMINRHIISANFNLPRYNLAAHIIRDLPRRMTFTIDPADSSILSPRQNTQFLRRKLEAEGWQLHNSCYDVNFSFGMFKYYKNNRGEMKFGYYDTFNERRANLKSVLPNECRNIIGSRAVHEIINIGGNLTPAAFTVGKNLRPSIPAGSYIFKAEGSFAQSGIILIKDIAEFMRGELSDGIVMEYVTRPRLLHGLKFHIRSYLCIYSTSAKTANIYNHFAVSVFDKFRIMTAAEKYLAADGSPKDIGNIAAHISSGHNTSRQFNFPQDFVADFAADEIAAIHSSVMRVTQLAGERIILSNLNFTGYGDSAANFFVFAADIILGENMVPKILEINNMPGFAKFGNDEGWDNYNAEFSAAYFSWLVDHIILPHFGLRQFSNHDFLAVMQDGENMPSLAAITFVPAVQIAKGNVAASWNAFVGDKKIGNYFRDGDRIAYEGEDWAKNYVIWRCDMFFAAINNEH